MLNRASFVAAVAALSLVAAAGVARADTSISAGGSTALQPLVRAAATEYESQHPDVHITVSGGGSGNGINRVHSHAYDIGDSDILAAGYPELIDHRVAVVAFAPIVNPAAGVKNLTHAQIRDIFLGKITNWKSVGGADVPIALVNREPLSGTRAVFTRMLLDGSAPADGAVANSTGEMVADVAAQRGAIGYASVGSSMKTAVVELTIDGIASDAANVIIGKYPLWSYEHMFTSGAPSAEVGRFIEFVSSATTLVKKMGYIPLAEMKVQVTDR